MELKTFDDFKHLLQSGRLNFLVGSGLSSPYLGTLGQIEQKLEELDKTPDTIQRTAVRASILKEYLERCIQGNCDLAANTENAAGQEVLTNYRNFLNSINKVVLLRKSNLLSKQINFFTTNIDIFPEKALEQQQIEFNDGFVGRIDPTFDLSNFKKSCYKTSSHYDNKSEVPLFNLFKLHGSVNWLLETEERIKLDNKLELLKKACDQVTAATPKLVAIFNTGGEFKSITDLLAEATAKNYTVEQQATINGFLAAYDKLAVINPTKEKFRFTTLNYTYYELLRMFSNELERENSILFVMGFSFADEHIREIVLRALNSNPTLLVCVFAYNEYARNAIKKNLGFETVEPKNDNLKFMSFEGGANYDLRTINELHFAKLANNLVRKDTPIAEGA